MNRNTLQLINDEIICHKKAIQDVEEKLNLLSFLNGIDTYMGKSLNLDANELMTRRIELENKLKSLIDKKSEITGKEEHHENLKPKTNFQNTHLMSNYLSLHNFENPENETNVNS